MAGTDRRRGEGTRRGGRFQDLDWLVGVGAQVGLVSVGTTTTTDTVGCHPRPAHRDRDNGAPDRSRRRPGDHRPGGGAGCRHLPIGSLPCVGSPRDRRPRPGHSDHRRGVLGERAVAQVRDAVRRHDAEAEQSETRAIDLSHRSLGEISAPRCSPRPVAWSSPASKDLPEDRSTACSATPPPGRGGRARAPSTAAARGSRVLTKLAQAAARHRGEVGGAEGRGVPGSRPRGARRGGGVDQDAALLLVQAVGQDLRSLAAAATQLVGDFPRPRSAWPR